MPKTTIKNGIEVPVFEHKDDITWMTACGYTVEEVLELTDKFENLSGKISERIEVLYNTYSKMDLIMMFFAMILLYEEKLKRADQIMNVIEEVIDHQFIDS